MMRLWTCVDHDVFWPVGGASIVVASDEDEARSLLSDALRATGLDPDEGFTLQEVPLDRKVAIVLKDGEY